MTLVSCGGGGGAAFFASGFAGTPFFISGDGAGFAGAGVGAGVGAGLAASGAGAGFAAGAGVRQCVERHLAIVVAAGDDRTGVVTVVRTTHLHEVVHHVVVVREVIGDKECRLIRFA